MTIEELYRFVEASKAGSIGSAAESLNISTQGLSQSIRRLEAELGVSLFERNIGGVVLTPVGKTIYSYANEILEISQKISDCARDAGAESELRIRCAIVNSIIADYAKSELDSIAESERLIIEYINCGEKRQLDRLFQQKGCEVILTFRHDSNDVYTDWRAIPIYNLPIGIVVNRNSELYKNGFQGWDQLSLCTVATDAEEKNIRGLVDRLYASEKIVLKRISFHGIRRCLESVASDPSSVTFTYKSKFISSNIYGDSLEYMEIKQLPALCYAAYLRTDLLEFRRIKKILDQIRDRMTSYLKDI